MTHGNFIAGVKLLLPAVPQEVVVRDTTPPVLDYGCMPCVRCGRTCLYATPWLLSVLSTRYCVTQTQHGGC